ncbi:FAD-dependent oxidoreductase [Bacillus lacus]|uniref:Glycerol-3-phosphate dehydrogenase n=1 Tax=Metabacillus lacus TaxID=1983721 RepID=A0A7X2IXN8_9BACI|nr:FAD-dependent oxidoreductase [Metabacillus lacus]MRX71560.1 FAD-dependent oxidoreductase [Metabacillus lacus]
MANNKFSSLNREQTLKDMANETFDVLVIGGGITGAGIALDAASRGMKVGVVEMQDFAAGTSSRSTKLVHGGLRYLKQFEVKMVAEVGKERAVVYENGPHVTTPEWMLLPMHKGGTFGKFSTSIGLQVYDLLANVKRNERRKMLSAEETLKREPLVKKDGLVGGGYYVEYRTDDARLTIEVMKKAVEHGAVPVNYAKADGFVYDAGGKVTGVKVLDLINNGTYEISANKVINATGPWVDGLREKDSSKKGKHLQLTKGIHLVFDQSKFPLRQAIYFDTPDKRMVFAIPREGKTYVGTTDTVYKQDQANPRMTESDREYVVNAIQYMFPDLNITENDVESSWAGLRPLIHEEGKGPSEISRKDEIWESQSGLITIAGGKLTGYRKMAEQIVNLIARKLKEETGKDTGPCITKNMPISGGDVGGSAGFGSFVEKKVEQGIKQGLSREDAAFLASRYGSNADLLFQRAADLKQESEKHGLPIAVLAELDYSMTEEMTSTAADFFIRRTGAVYFNIDWARKWKKPAVNYMASKLNWSESFKQEQLERLELSIKEAAEPISS